MKDKQYVVFEMLCSAVLNFQQCIAEHKSSKTGENTMAHAQRCQPVSPAFHPKAQRLTLNLAGLLACPDELLPIDFLNQQWLIVQQVSGE